MNRSPMPARPQSPDWWARNWKWLVPLLVLGAMLGFVVFFASVMGFIKSSEAYIGAVARAQSDAEVAAALGTPIREGWFCAGSVSLSGDNGRAELQIPVSGPKSKATIFVVASKSAGTWRFERLIVFLLECGRQVDLSDPRPGEPARSTAPRDRVGGQ